MRSVAYLVVLSTVACAGGQQATSPPVVSVPVPPAAPSDPPASTASPPPAPDPAPAACTTTVTRHVEAKKVAECQAVPWRMTGTVAFEERPQGADRVAIRIVRDDEQADNVPPTPSLRGKSYVAERSGGSLVVHGEDGASGVPEDEAARIRAMAAVTLGWPGTDASALSDAIRRITDVHLRGAPAREVDVKVHPEAATRFQVKLRATESDAGMCHRWTDEETLEGPLVEGDGGQLASLALHGSVHDTEALCPEGARQAGVSAAPRTCNAGEASLSIDRRCAAASR